MPAKLLLSKNSSVTYDKPCTWVGTAVRKALEEICSEVVLAGSAARKAKSVAVLPRLPHSSVSSSVKGVKKLAPKLTTPWKLRIDSRESVDVNDASRLACSVMGSLPALLPSRTITLCPGQQLLHEGADMSQQLLGSGSSLQDARTATSSAAASSSRSEAREATPRAMCARALAAQRRGVVQVLSALSVVEEP